MNINEWLKAAVRYVPFGKERTAVKAELLDHYCDRLDALMSTGVDPGDAEKRALAALGDPDETGRLLRRVHRPGLTWALRLIRLALILLLVLSFANRESIKDSVGAWIDSRANRDPAHFSDDYAEEGAVLEEIRYGASEDEGSYGKYRVTVADAWRRWFRYERPWDITGDPMTPVTQVAGEYRIFLRIEAPFWVEPDLDYIGQLVTVEDEAGLWSTNVWGFAPCEKVSSGLGSCIVCISLHNLPESDAIRLRGDAWNVSFDFLVRFGPREKLSDYFSQPAEDEAALLPLMGRAAIDEARGVNKTFQIRSAVPLKAEPASLGTLTASVPWAELEEVQVRRTRYSDGAESDYEFCYTSLQFVVKLEGPWEELFLCGDDLEPRLLLTDSLGNQYPFYSTCSDYMVSVTPTVYEDRGYYRFGIALWNEEDPRAPEWLELTIRLDDGTICLRLVPEEGG